jgi:hypothetical protein
VVRATVRHRRQCERRADNGIGTDLGSGSAFNHLEGSARGSCCQLVDETVYLSVLFPGTRSLEGRRFRSVSCSQRGEEVRPIAKWGSLALSVIHGSTRPSRPRFQRELRLFRPGLGAFSSKVLENPKIRASFHLLESATKQRLLGLFPTGCAQPSSSLSCSTDKPFRRGPASMVTKGAITVPSSRC